MTTYAPITYTGDGTTTSFAIPFEFLNRSDVTVKLNSVASTDFVWTAPSTIRFNTAPANGVGIVISRQTKSDGPVAFFSAGNLKADDLNREAKQAVFLYEELAASPTTTITNLPSLTSYQIGGGQSIDVTPTGNPPGITKASIFGNFTTLYEDKMEFFQVFNAVSNKGSTNAYGSALGSKVTGFFGMSMVPGSGSGYCLNGVLSIASGVGNQNAIGLEIDVNNNNIDYGATGPGGESGPVGAALYIAGSGTKKMGEAILINLSQGQFPLQRGIAMYNGTFALNAYEDTSNAIGSGIYLSGTKGVGVNLEAGTYTLDAIRTPGFKVNPSGVVSTQSVNIIGDPGALPSVDVSSVQFGIDSGANRSFATGLCGRILVTDCTNGATAEALVSLGNITLIAAIPGSGSTFEVNTVTPAAGNSAIAWNGSAYIIVNGAGARHNYSACFIKTH